MEQKNKVFLALLIALVMVVAILSSFGLNFFSGDQPEIVLPSPVITDSGEQSADDPTAGGGFLPVDVTPETVQSVIATLERPENYQSWRKAPAFRHGDISHTLLPRKEILRGLH